METLLIHQGVATDFMERLLPLMKENGVELRGNTRACEIATSLSFRQMKPADESDWDREYLDLILSVAVVEDLDAAAEHIAKHGSQHSDAIIADSTTAQARFVQQVDASAVYINASTRFTDGGEFGMGAEIGISTDKLHARGPMGLNELNTYKYVIRGEGQIR
jgi:glutamate-5-semialdehyde dehydrogenase